MYKPKTVSCLTLSILPYPLYGIYHRGCRRKQWQPWLRCKAPWLFSLSSNSFLGQRLTIPPALSHLHVKPREKLQRWEWKECKPKNVPVLHKMHIKVGDSIKVISGCDKSKIGEITKIFKHNSTIVVNDINLKTKHIKSREEVQRGQIIKIEAPIHSSNMMLYSKEQDVMSWVGHKVLDDGKRVRYLIKTGEIIDSDENWKKLKEAGKEKNEVAVAAS